MLGSDLVLIGPASVIGHGGAAEQILAGWVVDEKQQNLPTDVDVLEIVPIVFWSHRTVADENELGIQLDLINDPFGVSHIVGSWLQLTRVTVPADRQDVASDWGDANKRNLLNPGSVRIPRLEPERTELSDQILNRAGLPHGTWRPTLEFIRRELLDLRQKSTGVDAGRDSG